MTHLNKTKNRILLILFLLSFVSTGFAQNTVSYAYDNAGNRISRVIVLNSSKSPQVKKDSIAPAPVVEQLGDRKILVYPNPTKGALAVEITGGSDKDGIRIVLFSAQGIQLKNLKTTTGTTAIDMHLYPPGWFILRVLAGDKVTEFKIIKE
jgi:hypothetical protein